MKRLFAKYLSELKTWIPRNVVLKYGQIQSKDVWHRQFASMMVIPNSKIPKYDFETTKTLRR